MHTQSFISKHYCWCERGRPEYNQIFGKRMEVLS